MKPEDGLLVYHTATNGVEMVNQRVHGSIPEGHPITVKQLGGMLVVTQKRLIYRSRDAKFISIKTDDIRRMTIEKPENKSKGKSIFDFYRGKKRNSGQVIIRARQQDDSRRDQERDNPAREEEITLRISLDDIDEEYASISDAWNQATRPKKKGSLLETPEICKRFTRCQRSDDAQYSFNKHRWKTQ